MADNKENVKVSAEVETISTDYDSAKGELDNLEEIKFYGKDIKGDSHGTISKILDEAKTSIFEQFKEKNEGIEVNSLEELDEEKRKIYDDFLKNSEEVQKIYDETDEKVKKENKDRNARLHEVSEKIDELAKQIESKLKEIDTKLEKNKEDIENKQKEIDALKPEDFENEEKFKARQKELTEELSKLKDEKSTLENDKQRLENIQKEITKEVTKEDREKAKENGEKIPQDGLKQQLSKSLSNQALVRAGAQAAAKEIFGEDRVKEDFGLSDLDKADIEKESAQNKGQVVQQGAPIQGGAPAAGFAPQQAQKEPEKEEIRSQEEPDEEEIEDNSERINFFLAKLGYQEGDKLTGGRAVKLLENYVNNELTDSERLEMLAYPECKDIILEAMENANKSMNPINKIKFDKTRKELVNLSDRLVIKSIQELGENVPEGKDAIEEKYYDIRNSYDESRNKIEERLKDENLTKEQRKEIKSELRELDKKYASIHNLEDYRDCAVELERKRDAIIDKISGMFSTKDKLTGVPKIDSEKEAQNKVTDMFINKLEDDLVNGKIDSKELENIYNQGTIEKDRYEYYCEKYLNNNNISSLKNLVKTEEEALKSDIDMEVENKGKDTKVINKQENDIGRR